MFLFLYFPSLSVLFCFVWRIPSKYVSYRERFMNGLREQIAKQRKQMNSIIESKNPLEKLRRVPANIISEIRRATPLWRCLSSRC